MDKKTVELAHAYHLLNHGAVLLVSVGDGERDNLLPVAWNMPAMDEPPLVTLLLAREHFSFPFVEKTGELGLNVPDASLLDAVYGCGRTSGREVRDKFGRFGLTRQRASQIRAPLVAEAVANLECRVERIEDVEGCALVLARVVAAVAAVAHFALGRWQFGGGLQLIHHLDGNRFCVSERVLEAKRP